MVVASRSMEPLCFCRAGVGLLLWATEVYSLWSMCLDVVAGYVSVRVRLVSRDCDCEARPGTARDVTGPIDAWMPRRGARVGMTYVVSRAVRERRPRTPCAACAGPSLVTKRDDRRGAKVDVKIFVHFAFG